MLDPSKPAHTRAEQRLRSERIAWLTTVRADGQAQSSPVWFLWDGQTFLLYSQPGAQKVRNLAANPKVALHLDDAKIVPARRDAHRGDARPRCRRGRRACPWRIAGVCAPRVFHVAHSYGR